MLRVAKVGRGGHVYYLEVAARPGGTDIEPPGRWVGRGAAALGLGGTVSEPALGALLRGDHPVTAQRLGRFHDRVQVAAFDLTFCAPKSVSLLHALGAPTVAAEVAASHGSAVAAALDYVERRAVAVRRRHGGPGLPERATAVAGAAFVHRTSRALDPHLHSHVVLANLGRGPEGSFTALDGRGVYAHAPAAAALYHAHLRHELTTRLGVAFEPLHHGRADVAGIGPEARRAFSQRALAIAEHMAARGLSSGRAATIAGHATRPPRDVSRSFEHLQGWWHERAAAVGLGPERLGAALDRVARRAERPDPAREPEVTAALARRGPTATRRDLVRAWCTTAASGAPAPSIERAADRTLDRLTAGRVSEGVERCGVGERRHVLGAPALERRAGGDERALYRLLRARGMEPVALGTSARGRDDLEMGIG